MTENNIINSLWIGNHLSNLEILTLHSFTSKGHEFHLWTYEKIDNLPAGIVIMDASTIISRDKIFNYKENSIQGIGKGSYAGFSDIFRFRLLFLEGGWWVDMDLTCLRYFEIECDYFFPAGLELKLTTNILKCPKNSPLMQACYERGVKEISETSKDYTLPVKILNEEVVKQGLMQHIRKDFVNYDSYVILNTYLKFNIPPPENLYAIHWCNVIWATYHINKNIFYQGSVYANLLTQYKMGGSEDFNPAPRIFFSVINIQDFLFHYLTQHQKLLILLKKIKKKFSGKFNLWL